MIKKILFLTLVGASAFMATAYNLALENENSVEALLPVELQTKEPAKTTVVFKPQDLSDEEAQEEFQEAINAVLEDIKKRRGGKS